MISAILRTTIYFIMTLFWGIIGFHSGGELAGGLTAVFGVGLSSIGTEIVTAAHTTGVDSTQFKDAIWSMVGTLISAGVVLLFVYAKG